MRKESTESRSESRPEWEQLEDWVRSQVQRLIQELLEEEVTAFLGRAKSALRSDSDSDTGYRNGYGRARRLTLSSGTIQLRRPRVRDTEEQFESRLLPLFVNRTRKVAELIPELYLHGLSEGDFDLALRGLLGEDAPVSASTVARLKDKWNDELAQWRSRPLDDLEVVYMWVDGVYVKAGLEKEKAAVLVVMAALSDGSKVVVSAVPGYRESTENWSEVLRDIKRRGLSCPRLVVGDGHLGIWGALRNVYPQAAEQRCWNHKIVNVLAKEVSSKSVYPVRRCTLCLNNTGLRPKRGDTPPMRKESTESRSESRPEWEQLEDWVRSQVQRLIQELLEEEVTAFLGRAKSALRSDSDSDTGYRNGYGRARRLTLSSGTIQLRRPRVRDTEEQFESRLLPLFVNRTRKVAELIPELCLHGLSEGDFDLALRGLLGEDASVSASTVARLKSKWNDELAQWRSRPLDDLEVVYMWVDGVYVKAGLEKEKAAVLVVMAALSDGSKVVVSTVPGYRESTENWSEVLRDIKRRGLSCPRLVVGDGHLGIWGALRNVYPQAAEQRCWNHKIVNVLAKLPKRQQDQAKLMLRPIPYAQTRTEAERLRTEFTRWCRDHSYEAASVTLERDWDRMITFYDFPKEHWSHLRTTNPVESPFAALRLRTDAAKRYKRVDRAIAVIWKMLMVAEQRFRRLKAPELIEDVYLGTQYVDGIVFEPTAEKVAA